MSELPSEITSGENKKRSEKPSARIIRSKELFADGREVVIEHNDGYYRLSITRTGKLILNK